MKRFLHVAACLTLVALAVQAQNTAESLPRLTNKDVLEMVKASIAPEVIIAKIKVSRCNFDTEPSILAELKRSGVSNDVSMAMINAPYGKPEQPTSTPLMGGPPRDVQNQSRQSAVTANPIQPRVFRHDKNIETKYDRFKDKTTIVVRAGEVYDFYGGSIDIVALASYPGQTPIPTEEVFVYFYYSGKEWFFLKYHDWAVLADGARLDVPEMKRVDSDVHRGYVSEIVGTAMPFSKFATMLLANVVEMKVGRAQFQVKEKQLEALRDFASRIIPSVSKAVPHPRVGNEIVTTAATPSGADLTGSGRSDQDQVKQFLKAALDSDARNKGIEVSVYFATPNDASTLAYDLQSVPGDKSMTDVFRVFLQFANKVQAFSFNTVELRFRGQQRFRITGEYFQKLGRELGTQNAIYTIRTFPQHLVNPDGSRAYPSRTGGMLAVLNAQMNDVNDFHKKWYVTDLLSAMPAK